MSDCTMPIKTLLDENVDLKGKIVLLRVDHNVVKKGIVKDSYRIDATIPTLYNIVKKGGLPVVMTHVGRPKDKKTGEINCVEDDSIRPIASYLETKLSVKVCCHEFPIDPGKGITSLDDSIFESLDKLRNNKVDMVYLPNTRWFTGEQSKDDTRIKFTGELARIGDVYVNDAFGSWDTHVSTVDIASRIPSYAGVLMKKEIVNMGRVLDPQKPFTGIIAGAKYDTKIGPMKALYKRVDKLILGGLMYNTFLAAKYDLDIKGVPPEDIVLAKELVEIDKSQGKIIELGYLIETDNMEIKKNGNFRKLSLKKLKQRGQCGYIVDVDPESFEDQSVKDAFSLAKTIFANAVMGYMPYFPDGSRVLYRTIFSAKNANKLFGGGDTLQELKSLCPGEYLNGMDNPSCYYFTGGGSVLAAIENGTPYGLAPVKALLKKE